MLALRRLPRYAPRLVSVRGNATLEAASTQASAPPPPPPPQPVTAKSPAPAPAKAKEPAPDDDAAAPSEQPERPKGTQRKWPTRRPSISLERPREWCRPIAKGVEPAYDYALRYILRDAAFVRKELEELLVEVRAEEAKPEGERDGRALEEMREKVRVLEIQAEANLPDVRWKARNGMGEWLWWKEVYGRLTRMRCMRVADMSKPIYRHLVEQKWREEGDLDLLVCCVCIMLENTGRLLTWGFRWSVCTR